MAEEFLHGVQRNIELFSQLGLRDGASEMTEHSMPRGAESPTPQPTVWPGY